MVRKTKWIEHSASDEQVDEVARRALTGRLDFVWHYLARAAADDHEPEDVHQLRVATRRAVAALQIFEALLPPRRARKMNKQLKRIRRAASDARNPDVHSRAPGYRKTIPLGKSVKQLVCGELIAELRRRAQPPIDELYAHLVEKHRFVRRQRALVSRVRIRSSEEPTESHTFLATGRHDLGLLVDQFFLSAAADLNQPAALHAMRICGKRVRYAMEIFAGAFGPSLRQELYPLVVEIQEKLGGINDHVTAAELYAEWLDQTESAASRNPTPADCRGTRRNRPTPA